MSSTKLICLIFAGLFCPNSGSGQDKQNLPLVDISGETDRHVIIAAGTESVYQGHPTT